MFHFKNCLNILLLYYDEFNYNYPIYIYIYIYEQNKKQEIIRDN